MLLECLVTPAINPDLKKNETEEDVMLKPQRRPRDPLELSGFDDGIDSILHMTHVV